MRKRARRTIDFVLDIEKSVYGVYVGDETCKLCYVVKSASY